MLEGAATPTRGFSRCLGFLTTLQLGSKSQHTKRQGTKAEKLCPALVRVGFYHLLSIKAVTAKARARELVSTSCWGVARSLYIKQARQEILLQPSSETTTRHLRILKNPIIPKREREKEKEALKSETSSTMWGDIEKSKYVIITIPENRLNSLKGKDCHSKTQINKAL